jgi:hypothetical protein
VSRDLVSVGIFTTSDLSALSASVDQTKTTDSCTLDATRPLETNQNAASADLSGSAGLRPSPELSIESFYFRVSSPHLLISLFRPSRLFNAVSFLLHYSSKFVFSGTPLDSETLSQSRPKLSEINRFSLSVAGSSLHSESARPCSGAGADSHAFAWSNRKFGQSLLFSPSSLISLGLQKPSRTTVAVPSWRSSVLSVSGIADQITDFPIASDPVVQETGGTTLSAGLFLGLGAFVLLLVVAVLIALIRRHQNEQQGATERLDYAIESELAEEGSNADVSDDEENAFTDLEFHEQFGEALQKSPSFDDDFEEDPTSIFA